MYDIDRSWNFPYIKIFYSRENMTNSKGAPNSYLDVSQYFLSYLSYNDYVEALKSIGNTIN